MQYISERCCLNHTCERPLAPCPMFFTQSPARKTFGKEVCCSGIEACDPGLKCVTAFGNFKTAESTTCNAQTHSASTSNHEVNKKLSGICSSCKTNNASIRQGQFKRVGRYAVSLLPTFAPFKAGSQRVTFFSTFRTISSSLRPSSSVAP